MLNDSASVCLNPRGILAEVHRENVARSIRLGRTLNVAALHQAEADLRKTERDLDRAIAVIAEKDAQLAAKDALLASKDDELLAANTHISFLKGVDATDCGTTPIRLIAQKCADYYKISLVDLMSARRTRVLVRPRQVAAYLAKKLTTASLPEIGMRLGGRDHTTIHYSALTISGRLVDDANLQRDVETIKANIAAAMRGRA